MVIQLFPLLQTGVLSLLSCDVISLKVKYVLCRNELRNHAGDLFPNVSVTFLIHVPRCSLPEDISLSLFYWYLWCDAVWVRVCDSSLSKAALGVFAAERKAIMYLSPAAKHHTLHRSSFFVPFSEQKKAKYVLLFHGRWNISETGKPASIITKKKHWQGISFFEVQAVYLKWSAMMSLKSNSHIK